MNTQIKNILDIVEDIKYDISDNSYKTILDNLMVLNNKKRTCNNKFLLNKIKLYDDVIYFIKFNYIIIEPSDINFESTNLTCEKIIYHYYLYKEQTDNEPFILPTKSDIKDVIKNNFGLKIYKKCIIGLK
jgi:hypothetical protein